MVWVNKKEVEVALILGIVSSLFVLVFSGFVFAAPNPNCDPTDDPNINGVEINNGCYNCGTPDDLVCPSYYGAICTEEENDADNDCKTTYWGDENEFSITEASMVSAFGTVSEITVTLIAGNLLLLFPEDTPIMFEVYEEDTGIGGFDDNILTNGDNNALIGFVDGGGRAVVSWTITQTDLEAAIETVGGEPSIIDVFEFYFEVYEAQIGGGGNIQKVGNNPIDVSDILIVTVSELDCGALGINLCDDYTDSNLCGADPCMAAQNSCGDGEVCGCLWDGSVPPGNCDFTFGSEIDPICGDAKADLGEQCDDGDLRGINFCNDYGFTGSNNPISCINPNEPLECHYNTGGCGSPGGCGNNILNTGEECDRNQLGPFTNCQDFGFSNGNLACNSSCNFDLSDCTGGSGGSYGPPGICILDESTDDNCDDGFLSYSYDGVWEWAAWNSHSINPYPGDGNFIFDDSDGMWHYDPNLDSENCEGGDDVIPCPAQIKLPFFGIGNLIAALIVIALVYYVFFLRKGAKESGKVNMKKRK